MYRKIRGFIILLLLVYGNGTLAAAQEKLPPKLSPSSTYAEHGDRALHSLLKVYYAEGKWKQFPNDAHPKNHDWGVDALTYDLYLRWLTTGDKSIPPLLEVLASSMSKVPAPLRGPKGSWSDEFLWDSIAGAREYEVTGSSTALTKAKAGFDYVDQAEPGLFTGGASPGIYFQRPDHASGGLKTLETDSNYVKAALLLYADTKQPAYLDKAKEHYAAIRKSYLDTNGSNLYSVYVFDTGLQQTQVPGRFYTSVNGLMIFNGLKLAAYTGDHSYLDQAIATAKAVDSTLSDARGIYVNLQAENDIAEPLVEAMYLLWTEQHLEFAKNWILRNARAAAGAVQPDTGAYGRFFDGPPPVTTVTAFQANGGYALAFTAAGIDPTGIPAPQSWNDAVSHDQEILSAALPATIDFTGSGIALLGTIGEQNKEGGHIRLLVDGVEPKDTTGIWQNKSSAEITIPDALLFAWQWPSPGKHTITLLPGVPNAKEGGSFVHIRKYLVKP